MQRAQKRSSRHRIAVGRIVLAFILGLWACQTAPITGRQQLMLVSSDEENRLGIEAYEKILQEEMAKAGYDPHEAIPFWERMSSGKQGKGAPEFLSTHPSGDRRIQQLRQWMPEALQYYDSRRS